MAELEHAPLLNGRYSQRAYHGYAIDWRQGNFRKELYFLFKTTIPVMAGKSFKDFTCLVADGPSSVHVAEFHSNCNHRRYGPPWT